MASHALRSLLDRSPSEILEAISAPEGADVGAVVLCGVLFPAARWVEDDGCHVVVSLEGDISGLGDDWEASFESFFASAGDLVTHLANLVTEGSATPSEAEFVGLMAPRLNVAFQRCLVSLDAQVVKLERRRLNLFRRSHHRPSPETWLPELPKNSSQLLPV